MTLIKHELRQNAKLFWIWTICIALFIAMCVMMFPDIQEEMQQASEMFASMGAFSQAFGMDQLNIGTLMGFYSLECGNILGLGGAFFSCLISVTALAKEEKEHTAEFLFAHPLARGNIVTQKLVAIIVQIVAMNVLVFATAIGCMLAIDQAIPWDELCLIHLTYLLLQLELAGICFGISAFLYRASMGIGLGVATGMYSLNIIANLSEQAEWLKYITPFGYTDGADLLANKRLDTVMLLLGMLYLIVGVVSGYWYYLKKDLR